MGSWFGASASVVELPSPPRPWRSGRLPKLSEGEIRRLHDRHMGGTSISQLAGEIWEGRYASRNCAVGALHGLFQRRGLKTRTIAEANRLRGKLQRGPHIPHSRRDQAGYRRARKHLHARKTPRKKVLA